MPPGCPNIDGARCRGSRNTAQHDREMWDAVAHAPCHNTGIDRITALRHSGASVQCARWPARAFLQTCKARVDADMTAGRFVALWTSLPDSFCCRRHTRYSVSNGASKRKYSTVSQSSRTWCVVDGVTAACCVVGNRNGASSRQPFALPTVHCPFVRKPSRCCLHTGKATSGRGQA